MKMKMKMKLKCELLLPFKNIMLWPEPTATIDVIDCM